MIGFAYAFFMRLGRRAAFYSALALALITALGIAIRQGRKAAEADEDPAAWAPSLAAMSGWMASPASCT